MRKLVSLLLLLYPRWWRQRYQEEFHALSEDARFRGCDYFDIVAGAVGVHMNALFGKSAWKLLVTFVVLGILVGSGMAILWPRSYHSSAVIRLAADHQTERTAGLLQTAMSPATLERIIGANRLYEGTSMSESEKLTTVMRHIRVSIIHPGQNAIMIEYVASSPITAQRVTEALVSAVKTAHPPSMAFDVIDPPSLNRDPISPNVRNVILTGALAGLLCGFLVIALTARIRRDPPLRHA